MTWGALGDFVFEANAGPFEEDVAWDIAYAEHARIGRKATLQLTGLGLQSATWKIRLHHQTHPDIAAALQQLKDMAEQGGPQELTFGSQPDTGAWAGHFVIEGIKIADIARAPGGRIHSAEVELKLKEWVEREGLIVTENPKPPPAVRPAGQQKPKIAADSAYSKDK